MDVTIYKTTDCGGCKALIGMLPHDFPVNIVNITERPDLKPEGISTVPQVEIDGKLLDKPFSLIEKIREI